jgi:protein-L-isoaspartate(D-aspartate) O-methyltransferase
MVQTQLITRGIIDERVLAAMGETPRAEFVPGNLRHKAYADQPLPIGHGQTISQPLVVAVMLQALALRGTERALEVGTGSGYSAAVLSWLVAEVVTVEWYAELADRARDTLGRLGIENVTVVHGDANRLSGGGFDVIGVHASLPGEPAGLLSMLAPGGRLIAPLAGRHGDSLTLFTRDDEQVHRTELGPVRFVPLQRAT